MKRIIKSSMAMAIAVAIVVSSVLAGLSGIDCDGLFKVEAKASCSGSLGEDVVWSYADGVLTVSGSGSITKAYDSDRSIIRTIIIEEGVTAICSGAFRWMYNLSSVTLPQGLVSVGNFAFGDCENLTSITIPASVNDIGIRAFGYCVDNVEDEYTYYSKVRGLVISGEKGSAAEDYATENKFTFAEYCFHSKTSLITCKPATVASKGLQQMVCDICGEVLKDIVTAQLTPEAPVVEAISDGGRVFISWNSVDGADEYIVYRRVYDAETKKWSGWTRIAENVTREFYSDYNVSSGTYYIYTVKGVNEGGYGAYTSGTKIYYLGKPKLLSLTASNNRMTLKWKAVEGATGYIVYRRVAIYSPEEAWKKECVTKNTTYVEENPEVGAIYRYTVKAYYGSYKSSVEQPGIFSIILSEPELESAVATPKGVKLKWYWVKGDAKYIVYRKTYDTKAEKWGGWTKLATVDNNNYVDTKAKSGTYYRYTVKAVRNLYNNKPAVSTYDKMGLKIYYIAQPKLKSATSAKSGVTLKWDKVKGASGYIVYRKTNDSGWVKLATVKGNSKISYLDKSAEKGKEYTYTVVAYNGAYKSSYDGKGLYVKDKY